MLEDLRELDARRAFVTAVHDSGSAGFQTVDIGGLCGKEL